MSTIRACANGGDGRAKSMYATLQMVLYRSPPPSRQQILETSIEIGDIVLDPSMPGYNNNTDKMINSIFDNVAKDSATDTIKELSKLNNDAAMCVRRSNEPVCSYVEEFLLPAQGYLNHVSADRAFVVSQGLAMNLLPNANLISQTFSSVITILVTTTTNKKSKFDSRTLVSLQRAQKAITVLETIMNPTREAPVLNNRESMILTNFVNSIHSTIKPHKLHEPDPGLSAYISLTDAVTALDEVSIDRDEIKSQIGRMARQTSTLY